MQSVSYPECVGKNPKISVGCTNDHLYHRNGIGAVGVGERLHDEIETRRLTAVPIRVTGALDDDASRMKSPETRADHRVAGAQLMDKLFCGPFSFGIVMKQKQELHVPHRQDRASDKGENFFL